jgi:two-component sensor histidine kinase
MSIRRRLFVLGGIFLLPVLGVGAWNEYTDYVHRERHVRETVAQEARYVASEFERLLDGARSLVETIAHVPAVQQGAWSTCGDLLTTLRPFNPGILALAATDASGAVMCASDQPAGAVLPTVGDRPHFRLAMQREGFVIGGYAYGRQTAGHVMHVAVVRRDVAGAVSGIVFATISLDWIAGRYARSSWSADHVVTVADAAGTVLMRQPGHDRFVGKPIPEASWSHLRQLSGSGSFEDVSPLDGVRRIVGYVAQAAPSPGLFMAVGVSRQSAFADLHNATLRGILASLIGILAAFGFAWFTARSLIARPFRQILGSAKALAGGRLDARSPVPGNGEFGQLAEAFNVVADRLTSEIRGKDMLLRELSHRVMNSLQMLNSTVLLQQRAVKDERTRELLGQIGGRVMAIAEAYRQLHRVEGEDVIDVGDLIAEVAEQTCHSLLADRSMCHISVQPLTLSPDRAIRAGLVANELVMNAIKYGGGPQAAVRVDFTPEGGSAVLAVRNRKVAREGQAGGGFGSRMVALLATDLGGTVEMREEEGEAVATLRFPVQSPTPAAPP